MATVVLTAVGTVVAGPVGGAIGALAGSAIDSQILASPGGAKGGPRLAELAVQTSSYGTAMPAVFGRMRIAGSVIWATDLKERSRSSGGGKGGGGPRTYSYSVSLAVAVSSRPIAGIGRIWADGKLLRGEGGDLKVDCSLRIHAGTGDQQPDPLIASAEALARSPAHRGIAYAVIEDLQLADYGNRIPSLTFEVIERPGALPAADVAAAAGVERGPFTGPDIAGYALAGRDALGALGDLAAGSGFTYRADGGRVTLAQDGPLPVATLSPVVAVDGAAAEGAILRRASASAAARRLDLRFYDVTADFQAGLASAERAGAGRRVVTREWPAAMTAAQAQGIAAASLIADQAGRETAGLTILSDPAIVPGARVAIDGLPGHWRVRSIEQARMTSRVECVRLLDAALPVMLPERRSVREGDMPAGPTDVALVEMPCLRPDLPRNPAIVAVANGGPGWRGAALTRVFGDARVPVGGPARPAVLGRIAVPPAAVAAPVIDRTSRIEVKIPAQFQLADADGDALRAGANVAMIGRELVQFMRAEPLGGGRWAISDLFRGLAGTDDQLSDHAAGEAFWLIDPAAQVAIDAPAPFVGERIIVEAQGVGDSVVAPASIDAAGQAMRPPAPVHGKLSRAVGGWMLSWTARSRLDQGWQDGPDPASVEGVERFAVSLLDSAGTVVRQIETGSAPLPLSADDLAGTVTISIVCIGRDGRSRPATVAVPV